MVDRLCCQSQVARLWKPRISHLAPWPVSVVRLSEGAWLVEAAFPTRTVQFGHDMCSERLLGSGHSLDKSMPIRRVIMEMETGVGGPCL